MRICGGDGGHGLSLVQYLTARQAIAAQIIELNRAFPKVGHASAWIGHIGGRNDCFDSGKLQCFGDFDAANDSVRVGAAQCATMQKTSNVEIGAVERTAGGLVYTIVTYRTSADDAVFGCHCDSCRGPV